MKKICIIKLGAKGDVVRTMAILPKLKQEFPSSNITWITKENARDIFLNNPYVDRILNTSETKLLKEEFDILYCLEIEKEASDIALAIKSKNKKGFYIENGYPLPFNLGAEYYINTFFDDDLKKKNKITAQEMMFMASDLKYNGEFCPIFLTDEEKEYGKSLIRGFGLTREKIVGIHIGASSKQWPSRFWTDEILIDFIKKAKSNGFEILLLGSPRKEEKLNKLVETCTKGGFKVYTNDVRNTDREYFSLINTCSVMVTPDSFAMHVSLALKKITIGLFFCTSPDEIEGYGLLKKFVSPMLYDFFPEKMDQYNEELTKSISADEVLNYLTLNNGKDK